jgi:hypothetical protein
MTTKLEPGWTICASVSGDLYKTYTVVSVREVGDECEFVLEDGQGERRTVMASKVDHKN